MYFLVIHGMNLASKRHNSRREPRTWQCIKTSFLTFSTSYMVDRHIQRKITIRALCQYQSVLVLLLLTSIAFLIINGHYTRIELPHHNYFIYVMEKEKLGLYLLARNMSKCVSYSVSFGYMSDIVTLIAMVLHFNVTTG